MRRIPLLCLLPCLLLVGCPRGSGPAGGGNGPTGSDDSQIQRVIKDLFDAYDSEDVQGYLDLVHRDFTGQDRTGNAYRTADLPRALRDDFQVMQRIRFEGVKVSSPLVREGAAQAEVQWGLRFLPESGGDEQILRQQRSVFHFQKDDEGRWKLSGIVGAAIFGVADREGRLRR